MQRDELGMQALIRAGAAFVVTLVVGGLLVFLIGRATDDDGTQRADGSRTPPPSGPTTVSPTSSPLPTWLMWIPGGLPDGVGPSITAVPLIRSATTATADIAWLSRSLDASDLVIDDPSDPYLIPLDVTGVEPSFSAFVPDAARSAIDGLQPGEGLLSETAAALRDVGEGATLEFDTGATVTVTGVLPDEMMGGYELLTLRGTAEDIGVTHERYVLFRVRPGANPDPLSLAAQLLPYLPEDAPIYAVEVRSPEKVIFRRANDRELPLALLKRRFGEFTAQLDPLTGQLTVDPEWIQDHIVDETLPVLGSISCHRKVLVDLENAVTMLEADDTASLITDVGDCYDPSAVVDDPSGVLSARDFGAAIDLNVAGNDPGEVPTQPEGVIKTMMKNGFGWGGKDAWPQGALFRSRRLPSPIEA